VVFASRWAYRLRVAGALQRPLCIALIGPLCPMPRKGARGVGFEDAADKAIREQVAINRDDTQSKDKALGRGSLLTEGSRLKNFFWEALDYQNL